MMQRSINPTGDSMFPGVPSLNEGQVSLPGESGRRVIPASKLSPHWSVVAPKAGSPQPGDRRVFMPRRSSREGFPMGAGSLPLSARLTAFRSGRPRTRPASETLTHGILARAMDQFDGEALQ
jgi:hypothetical protein